jgi:hypothetical protein
MYLHSFNFICSIIKESNRILGEEGTLACVYVCMYVCTYVCVYVRSVYVCIRIRIRMYVCHCISA